MKRVTFTREQLEKQQELHDKALFDMQICMEEANANLSWNTFPQEDKNGYLKLFNKDKMHKLIDQLYVQFQEQNKRMREYTINVRKLAKCK